MRLVFRLRRRAVRDDEAGPSCWPDSLSDVTEQRALQARLQHDSKMNALAHSPAASRTTSTTSWPPCWAMRKLASDEVPANLHGGVAPRAGDRCRASRARDRSEILAFSRPDEPRRSAVDLSQLVEETVRLLRPTLPQGVRMTVTVPSTPALVLGDNVQLQRVVINLCANSLDACGVATARSRCT
jgi:hypothetical protein